MLQQLLLIQSGATYDITECLSGPITWSGRKNAAGRTLDFDVIDTSKGGHVRLGIKVSKGAQVIYRRNDVELFRGQILKRGRRNNEIASLRAYDNLIYFANNEDFFRYDKRTASDIFRDICKRFSVPYDRIDATSYRCPKIETTTTIWDVIMDALSKTYAATKRRYYVTSQKGKVSLRKRSTLASEWVLETGVNIIDWSYEESAEDLTTRVKALNDKDKVIATLKSPTREKTFGIFQKIMSQEGDDSNGQTRTKAQKLLNSGGIAESFSVNSLGIADVYAGATVYVIVKDEGIGRTYYVDEDTHTFNGQNHQMKLTLNKKPDSEYEE
jgi:hypothetical protein